MTAINAIVRNLHTAIAAAVEAGDAFSCSEIDCSECPLVVYERDGTSYCGLYDLKQALKRMGPTGLTAKWRRDA